MSEKPRNIIKVSDFSSAGWGVGRRPEGKVAVVKGAVIGDTVEFDITAEAHSLTYGEAKKVIEASPDRIEHPCRHYYEGCPGCLLGAYDYLKGLEWKRLHFQETLRRIGRIEASAEAIISGEKSWGQRNRIELLLFHSGEAIDIGYKTEKRYVPIDDCLLATASIRQVLNPLKERLKAIKPGTAGLSARLLLRDNGKEGCAAVLFVPRLQAQEWRTHAESLKDLFYGWQIRSMQGLDHRFTQSVLLNSSGETTVYRNLCGKEIAVNILCFSQTNNEMEERMRQGILSDLEEGGSLLELYSGYGAWGLAYCIIKRGRAVLVDVNVEAVRAAGKFIETQELAAEVYAAEADVIGRLSFGRHAFDSVLADPPRSGLHTGVTRWLNAGKPGKFIYVSCHPAVLARDLAKLTGGKINKIMLFDMFPQTAEVEAVCFMELG